MKYAELTGASISLACETLETYLNSKNSSKKDTIRIVFTIEEVLLRFQSHFGEKKSFHLHCGKRWGRDGFTLCLYGERFDPFLNDDSEDEYFIINKLLTDLELTPTWNYRNGQNIVSFTVPKKKQNPLVALLVAAAAACGMGVLGVFLPPAFTAQVMVYVTPFYDAFIGVLSAASGPLVFLSVAFSICSIGDIATLGKIGSVIATRFVGMTYALLALGAVIATPFFSLNFSNEASAGNGMIDLLQMFLDIIPSNLVTPFVDNNLLQIIFMSVVFGVAVIVLSGTLAVLPSVVSDLNVVILHIMKWINRFLPAFVFISLWKIFWTSDASTFAQYAKPLAVYALCVAAFVLYYLLHVCLKCKLSMAAFIKTLMPAFLVALSTASSTAAFNLISDISKQKLGVHPKASSFGIPFGQVVYMPCCAIRFFIISLCFAAAYDTSVSTTWLVMCFLVSGILSIATPPIPNGGVVCLGILFIQLGIPDEALTLAVIINALTTNLCVACNLVCRQCDLMISAEKLDMINYDILHANCGKNVG